MRVIVQRVTQGAVHVDGRLVSEIGKGILCLAGLCDQDTEEDVKWMSKKILSLRLWPDEEGKPWKKSVASENYDVLLVSQFTLYGLFDKAKKPNFQNAMGPDKARELYATFVDCVKKEHSSGKVGDGEFGAMMQVSLVNDGPVTFTLNSPSSEPSPSIPAKVSPPKPVKAPSTADPAVQITRLEKKLNKVVALRQRVDKGDLEPNEFQQTKLNSEAALRKELEQLKLL